MKTLHRLIHSLNESEWEILLKFLTVFPNKNEPWKKILQLAKLLREEKDENLSAKVYSERISGKTNQAAVVRIGQMLRNKILECITLDSHLGDIDKHDADYGILQIKKKTAQYHRLMYTRSNTSEGQSLMEEIIKLSKEYEHYKTLTEYLTYKREIFCVTLGPKKYEAILPEIQFYNKCYRATAIGFDHLSKLKLLGFFRPNRDRLQFLRGSIRLLSKNYTVYKSKLILYALKRIEYEYYITRKNYEKAIHSCHELLSAVQNNKAIRKKQRIGIAHAQLSQGYLYVGNFTKSIEYAQKSLDFFAKDSRNYMSSKECEYYALFYNKSYHLAELCIKYILDNSPRQELGDFRYSQYNFLLANALFAQEKYPEALRILNDEVKILKNRLDWEISIRILKIMTLVEIKNTSDAERQIESLRKFISYSEKRKKDITLRSQSQLKILKVLAKNNFQFTKLDQTANWHLVLLEKRKNRYNWEYFSPEMTPFHQWVIGKQKACRLHSRNFQPRRLTPRSQPFGANAANADKDLLALG